MIYEYALEPEMVATWGELQKYRFFYNEFGFNRGRIVSRYPKSWAKKVYETYSGNDDMEKARLVTILQKISENSIKRKETCWEEEKNNWLANAICEHSRHPFDAILARSNPDNLQEIISEEDIGILSFVNWDIPAGITVKRNATEMAKAVTPMLSRCKWVKFIDPYFSKTMQRHKDSLISFLKIMNHDGPVSSRHDKQIEIHTRGNGASSEHLKTYYEKIIPHGMTATLLQWQEKQKGQKLHNRYILTDIGGVSFQHGLDVGEEGETDDITRLDFAQYEFRCRQYDAASTAFVKAEPPIVIAGKLKGALPKDEK